jgi:hypothetical protein
MLPSGCPVVKTPIETVEQRLSKLGLWTDLAKRGKIGPGTLEVCPMSPRFRESGCNSFFGDHYIYDRVVPKTHFLRRLKDLIDWEGLTRGLASHYKGGARKMD